MTERQQKLASVKVVGGNRVRSYALRVNHGPNVRGQDDVTCTVTPIQV